MYYSSIFLRSASSMQRNVAMMQVGTRAEHMPAFGF
jgi:hypothetical protein